MKKYFFYREVTSATGYQTFSVEADSLEDALKVISKTGGEYEDEEIEVTSLGPPEFEEEK